MFQDQISLEMSLKLITRLQRRIIQRHFGGVRRFLVFLCAIACSAYIINLFITPHPKPVAPVTDNDINSRVDEERTQVSNVTLSPSLCGIKEVCSSDKYPYMVRSGFLNEVPATICFNGVDYISASKVNGRGINLIVIDEKTLEVINVKVFDTFVEDKNLTEFLENGIAIGRVLMAASQDDAVSSLTKESKQLLQGFGSALVHKVMYRENFVLVGQKGLSRGTAIEKFLPRNLNKVFGDAVELSGCLGVPVGKLFTVSTKVVEKIKATESNCLVDRDCGSEAFPVRLYSGVESGTLPKMCINGKVVLEKEAGRGINAAIFDPVSKTVVHAGHFDTWEFNNHSLDKFLELVKHEQIIVAVTHDDASRNLNEADKRLFEKYGSWYIRKLALRDSWSFVGQRGMVGRSTFEELEFAPTGGAVWSIPLDSRMCVPFKMTGFALNLDASTQKKNIKRNEFCDKYSGYGDFCSIENRDETLLASTLNHLTISQNIIFHIPIGIVAGADKNSLRQQLESILAIPGVNVTLITVFFNLSDVIEYHDLCSLFGVSLIQVNNDVLMNAFEDIWLPAVDYAIILEEKVLPSRDFLSFFNQTLKVLEHDDTLMGTSAWNDNGYDGPSSDASLVYRTETSPRLGFLLKKKFYMEHMKPNWKVCCNQPSWEGWFESKLGGYEMVVPDLSRVLRQPLDDTSSQTELNIHLFNRRRYTSSGKETKLKDIELLTKDKYEVLLKDAISSAEHINASVGLKTCLEKNNPATVISASVSRKSFAILYDDTDDLIILCRCFRLFSLLGHKPRGLHRGLIRFNYRQNEVYLVGRATEYYKLPGNLRTIAQFL